MDSYEDRIRAGHDSFSSSFHRLADFLLDSYMNAAFLSATELAHELDLDPATVVRFAQRLGYSGYPQLQREIQTRLKSELMGVHNNDPKSPSQAAERAFEQIRRHLEGSQRSFAYEAAEALIAALDEAERVIIVAVGLALPPARTLAAMLEASGSTVHLSGGTPAELALAMAGARRGDLVMAIEVDGGGPIVSRALNVATHEGLRTAAIVATPSSEAALNAELILAAHASPEPGLGQVLVEAIIFALSQMLISARPGRYRAAGERAVRLKQRLTSDAHS